MMVALHKRIIQTLIPAFVLAVLPACTADPPGVGSNTAHQGGIRYHPDDDPLINPPELFAPYDPALADEDATLTRQIIAEPRNLNPIFVNSWSDLYFQEMLYSALFYRNKDLDWVLNTDRVARLEESEDRLVTRIQLTPGQTWHDGAPLTTADIRFTWEMITNDNVPAFYYKIMVSEIIDVKIIDDLTLEFHHAQANPMNNMHMGYPILPKHIFGKPEELAKDPTLSQSAYYNRYNREEVVGCGPYTFTEWKTNDRLVVDRWEEYPFRKPHFKRQILKIQPDRNISLLLFKKGELDEIWLTPQQFATQSNDAAYKRVGVKGYNVRRMFAYIGWNMDGSNPFFADKRVRLAMAHAFDSARVLRDNTFDLFTPSTGIFDPEHWCYNPDVKKLPYDLEKAARLLDDAGWLVSEHDGWRYKEIDGQQVKFDFELLCAKSFHWSSVTVNIFRDDLRKIGVSFRQTEVENALFGATYLRHEFQAVMSVWEVTNDPSQWLSFYHSDAHANGRNICGYKNDRVDELFELSIATYDREARAKYLREVQQIIYDDQPHLFVWNYAMLRGFNKDLHGVNFSPAGAYLFRPSWQDWWFERDRNDAEGTEG
jgi:peptide/nickel transport system substrate-binding protein